MKKITATIAKALAENAIQKIREAKDNDVKVKSQSLTKSKEFQIIKKRAKKIASLRAFQAKEVGKFQDKHKVYINDDEGNLARISTRSVSTGTNKDKIKNEIILLNHVDGVLIENLVDSIVKKYTKI